jgi:hypothetical protein
MPDPDSKGRIIKYQHRFPQRVSEQVVLQFYEEVKSVVPEMNQDTFRSFVESGKLFACVMGIVDNAIIHYTNGNKATSIFTPSHIENAHFSSKYFRICLKLHIFILSNFFICFCKSYIPFLIFVIQNQP